MRGSTLIYILASYAIIAIGLAQEQSYKEELKAASALSSNQALPDLSPEVTAALLLPSKAASTIAAAAAAGFSPFLHGSSQPNPSTTVNGITLAINVTEVKNGDYVGVTVTGVKKPSTYDALAIYLQDPSDSTVGLIRLIKYKWANQDPAYIKSGNTTFSFRVINQRRALVFNFFLNATAANGFFSPATLAAASAPLPFTNYNDPQQVHLALTKKQGEVLVQWTTRDAGHPTVLYGEVSGVLLKAAVGTNTTYTAADMCGAPANTTGFVDPGALNYVTISGLLPDTVYFYKAGDLTLGMSQEFSFRTAPLLGPSGTAKILAIADHGHAQVDGSTAYEQTQSLTTDALTIPNPEDTAATNTADELSALIYNVLTDDNAQQGSALYTLSSLVANSAGRSLFLLNGDVSYARGETASWDVYMESMQAIGSVVPWMLTEGNHERDVPFSGDRYNNSADDSGGECSVPYQRRTQSLGNPTWTPSSPAWYSYDQGPVHYLAYSTEIDFSPGSAQYNFIEADLAAVDRSVTPWVVLNGHRPIYTTSTASGVVSVGTDLRKALEPLLLKYQVDLTWHGHDHIYERTCPVYNGTCQPNLADGSQGGPVHVVIGHAGFTLSYVPNPFLPPYWTKVVLEHGYQPCTITATTFSCEMISSLSGLVLDSFNLTKPVGWKPDLAGRTAFLASFKQSYFPGGPYPGSGTYLETTGIPLTGALVIFAALEQTLANPAVIAQLAAMIPALRASVNGPDTVVTLAASLKPLLPSLQALAATTNCATPTACAAQFYAATAYVPIISQLEAAGAAYATKHGVLYP